MDEKTRAEATGLGLQALALGAFRLSRARGAGEMVIATISTIGVFAVALVVHVH